MHFLAYFWRLLIDLSLSPSLSLVQMGRAAGDGPMLFANREEAPRAAVAACALASRAREYTALRPIAGLGRRDRGWRAKWRGVWWAS